MKPSIVTDLLYNQLNFTAERQKVISSNISNINTPGYKTKDLVFEDELKKVNSNGDLKLVTTNKNHINIDINSNSNNSRFGIKEVENLEEQNDGNNVNLDTQMSEMAKNSVMFQALQTAVKKDSAWLKEIIASSGKN